MLPVVQVSLAQQGAPPAADPQKLPAVPQPRQMLPVVHVKPAQQGAPPAADPQKPPEVPQPRQTLKT